VQNRALEYLNVIASPQFSQDPWRTGSRRRCPAVESLHFAPQYMAPDRQLANTSPQLTQVRFGFSVGSVP
jgi:hypothetical protein